jgi:hypothetical protein
MYNFTFDCSGPLLSGVFFTVPRLVICPFTVRKLRVSQSELLYDWRFTANQFVLAPSPLRLTARIVSSSIEHLRP